MWENIGGRKFWHHSPKTIPKYSWLFALSEAICQIFIPYQCAVIKFELSSYLRNHKILRQPTQVGTIYPHTQQWLSSVA